MVQRKVPNKLGIKTHLLKSDTQLVNLIKPSSSSSSSQQTHEKLNNKIMKKPRPTKRVDEPPFKKKKTRPSANHEPRSTPNYMKSTSSFDARKEQSPKNPNLNPTLTSTPSPLKMSKTNGSVSGHKGSRTSSLKMKRTLTKTPSFKPLRPSKKVILCEDLDAQRATCSSTLKDSKFPNYLQLNHGGTELEGTSAMKVCPYTYCSLNGHHHDPLPPLKHFLSARRRALNLKTHKSFKLGCLSPKSPGKKNEESVKLDMKSTPMSLEIEEENQDFFVEVYSKDEGKEGEDLECCNIDWEEGYCSASCSDDVCEEKIEKAGVEKLNGELQELYDEESVSSGAWSDEDGDSGSESLYQQMKINHLVEDQDFLNCDVFEVSRTREEDVYDQMDDMKGLNLPIEDQNINFQQEETCKDSKTIPDFEEKSKDGIDENRTTIIYNIIQFNISIFVNGEKTEDSEMEKSVILKVPETCVADDGMETEEVKGMEVADDEMETEEVKEAMEEQIISNEYDEGSEVNQMVAVEEIPFDDQDVESNEQSSASNLIKKQDDNDFDQESKECETDKKQTDEITSETNKKMSSFCKKSDSSDDLREFNPRGPNFLPEAEDPDAETVDLRHQMIDERKNAEEWMVDFALQQAVTTLAPARKRKVALLVEAFEKVMPIPKYETHNRHSSKAFANARPMQACN